MSRTAIPPNTLEPTEPVLSIQQMLRIRLKEVMANRRKETGERLTLESLAKSTGMSLSTLQSIASRPTYNPRLSTISALCEALDCEPSDLLERERKGRT